MDREEKLRAAKEKLKKFQKKKQGDEKADISSEPSPRSTPKQDPVVEDLPLFTFESKSGKSILQNSNTSSIEIDKKDQVFS